MQGPENDHGRWSMCNLADIQLVTTERGRELLKQWNTSELVERCPVPAPECAHCHPSCHLRFRDLPDPSSLLQDPALFLGSHQLPLTAAPISTAVTRLEHHVWTRDYERDQQQALERQVRASSGMSSNVITMKLGFYSLRGSRVFISDVLSRQGIWSGLRLGGFLWQQLI